MGVYLREGVDGWFLGMVGIAMTSNSSQKTAQCTSGLKFTNNHDPNPKH